MKSQVNVPVTAGITVVGQSYTDILAVDTGERTGISHFECGRLVQAITLDHDEVFTDEWLVDLLRRRVGWVAVFVEKPVARGRNTKSIDDLIGLGIKTGELRRYLISHLATVTLITPADWKGSLPKDVCQRRCESKLTAEEMMVLPKRMSNHAWDAVGINLWAHGRFG